MSDSANINSLKEWITFFVGIVACVAGVIFWIQSSSDPRFEHIENEISVLRQDIKNIRIDNSEILRIVGRLEGKLENQ